jgi:uncharacterized protein with FMN-binding domain
MSSALVRLISYFLSSYEQSTQNRSGSSMCNFVLHLVAEGVFLGATPALSMQISVAAHSKGGRIASLQPTEG